MTNIISLFCQNSILEIGQSAQPTRLTHIIISQSVQKAQLKLESIIKFGWNKGLQTQICDNIIKIIIGNPGCIFDKSAQISKQQELRNLQNIKGILSNIDKLVKEGVAADSILCSGFYYYDLQGKTIRYYQLQQFQTASRQKNKGKCPFSPVQVFGILIYLLYYSSNFKQYMLNWRKLAIKKQPFKADKSKFNLKSKLQKFIANLLDKQISTLKMANHSLEIILQKINWINCQSQNQEAQKQQNQRQFVETGKQQKKQINYADIRIDLGNQKKPAQRLRHSNSMTSISSSKARKYKKLSSHKAQIFKDPLQKYKTSQSFMQSKLTSMIESTMKVTNMFGNTKKYTSDNWYKEGIRQESFLNSFSRVMNNNSKQFQENSKQNVDNQAQLIKLLQKKQKNRSQGYHEFKDKSTLAINQLDKKTKHEQIEVNIIQRPRKQLNIMNRTIQMTIKPSKKSHNCRINSTIFSLSQNLSRPHLNQEEKQKSNLKGQVNRNAMNNSSQIKPKVAFISPQNYKTEEQSNNSNAQSQKNNLKQLEVQINNKSQNISINQLVDKRHQKAENKIQHDQEQQPNANHQSVSAYTGNMTFVIETVQIYGKQPTIRPYMLISLYAMYLYYIVNNYMLGTKIDQHQSMHLANINKVMAQLNKIMARQQSIKHMTQQDIDNVNYLIQILQGQKERIQIHTLQSVCKNVLQKQFEKNKTEILKRKSQLMKNNTLKLFLLAMGRLSIVITIIGSLQEHNTAAKDFVRYSEVVANKNQNQIDFLSQLRNFEQLFS